MQVEYTVTKPNGYKQKLTYMRRKYISPDQIQEMKEMVASGSHLKKDICAKFGISLPTLRKYVKEPIIEPTLTETLNDMANV